MPFFFQDSLTELLFVSFVVDHGINWLYLAGSDIGNALLSGDLILGLSLLQESLGDENLVGSWDASVSG